MAPLHPALTHPAATHRNVKPAHHGPPHNLFLILRFAAFRFHTAAAVRAVLRQWDGNLFVDARWDRAARPPAITAARLAAWPLRVGFWFSAGMRRRLTFAGPQSCVEFPAQTLTFLLQPVTLLLEPVVL